MSSPGAREEGRSQSLSQSEHEGQLGSQESSKYRAIVARCNYIAPGRPDIAYAVKELARHMANPTCGDWQRFAPSSISQGQELPEDTPSSKLRKLRGAVLQTRRTRRRSLIHWDCNGSLHAQSWRGQQQTKYRIAYDKLRWKMIRQQMLLFNWFGEESDTLEFATTTTLFYCVGDTRFVFNFSQQAWGLGWAGAQGILIVMCSLHGEQAIRAREQPATLADVHVSRVEVKCMTISQLAQEFVCLC